VNYKVDLSGGRAILSPAMFTRAKHSAASNDQLGMLPVAAAFAALALSAVSYFL